MNEPNELVDYYNDAGDIIGFCSRDEADLKNLIYPNVIVFVFTTDKRVWIQKRSMSKSHYPGIWDTSACGALEHDENPLAAALRELKEEIGLNCPLTFVERFLNIFPSEDGSETRRRMSYIFIGICDDNPINNHEVEAVIALDIYELLAKVRANPNDYVPSFDIELEKALKGYEHLGV